MNTVCNPEIDSSGKLSFTFVSGTKLKINDIVRVNDCTYTVKAIRLSMNFYEYNCIYCDSYRKNPVKSEDFDLRDFNNETVCTGVSEEDAAKAHIFDRWAQTL